MPSALVRIGRASLHMNVKHITRQCSQASPALIHTKHTDPPPMRATHVRAHIHSRTRTRTKTIVFSRESPDYHTTVWRRVPDYNAQTHRLGPKPARTHRHERTHIHIRRHASMQAHASIGKYGQTNTQFHLQQEARVHQLSAGVASCDVA